MLVVKARARLLGAVRAPDARTARSENIVKVEAVVR